MIKLMKPHWFFMVRRKWRNQLNFDSTISFVLVLRAKRLMMIDSKGISQPCLNTFVKVKKKRLTKCFYSYIWFVFQVTLSNEYEQCSKVIYGSNSPTYDERFSMLVKSMIQIGSIDSHRSTNFLFVFWRICNNKSLSTPSKRLTISLYNQSISNKK